MMDVIREVAQEFRVHPNFIHKTMVEYCYSAMVQEGDFADYFYAEVEKCRPHTPRRKPQTVLVPIATKRPKRRPIEQTGGVVRMPERLAASANGQAQDTTVAQAAPEAAAPERHLQAVSRTGTPTTRIHDTPADLAEQIDEDQESEEPNFDDEPLTQDDYPLGDMNPFEEGI
jgi:hypothetical protein